MASKVKNICEEKISPLINQIGYEVVDIEYAKKSDGMNLTFYIDNENGIDINDCEKVSKLIVPILDELNPTEDQPYVLNVSSPGIDRPLKNDRDFARNIGKEIEITLFAKVNGVKNFKGILLSFNSSELTIQPLPDKKQKTTLQNQITLEKSKIAHIVPIIKF